MIDAFTDCIIINGGEPILSCPKDWYQAKIWEGTANSNYICDNNIPKWKWDCGFKLDYDGPLTFVSSRFYPPKTQYADKWCGKLTIAMFGETLVEKEFQGNTLPELKEAVDAFINRTKETIKSLTIKEML